MSNGLKYKSILPGRKASVFTVEQQKLIQRLGIKVFQTGPIEDDLREFRRSLKSIRPDSYRRASSEIFSLAELTVGIATSPDTELRKRMLLTRAFRQSWDADRHIQLERDICFLLIFHANGHVRQRALEGINARLESAFEVISLLDLCNNWVPEVRAAALTATRLSFAKTDGKVLASAFGFSMSRMSSWKRWDDQVSRVIVSLMTSEKVLSSLSEQLTTKFQRGEVKALKYALRYPAIDKYLESIWLNSQNTNVRAVALKALLDAKASWTVGQEWTWIDKALGKRRKVPIFQHRALEVSLSRKELILDALSDAAAVIRKLAVQAMIDHREELDSLITEWVPSLVLDKSPSVQQRAEFLMRTQTQPTDPQT